MKLTKSRLKHMIKEELTNISANTENIEERSHANDEDRRAEWLVDRVGELFRRITKLEKQIGVEWKGEGN